MISWYTRNDNISNPSSAHLMFALHPTFPMLSAYVWETFWKNIAYSNDIQMNKGVW